MRFGEPDYSKLQCFFCWNIKLWGSWFPLFQLNWYLYSIDQRQSLYGDQRDKVEGRLDHKDILIISVWQRREKTEAPLSYEILANPNPTSTGFFYVLLVAEDFFLKWLHVFRTSPRFGCPKFRHLWRWWLLSCSASLKKLWNHATSTSFLVHLINEAERTSLGDVLKSCDNRLSLKCCQRNSFQKQGKGGNHHFIDSQLILRRRLWWWSWQKTWWIWYSPENLHSLMIIFNLHRHFHGR